MIHPSKQDVSNHLNINDMHSLKGSLTKGEIHCLGNKYLRITICKNNTNNNKTTKKQSSIHPFSLNKKMFTKTLRWFPLHPSLQLELHIHSLSPSCLTAHYSAL